MSTPERDRMADLRDLLDRQSTRRGIATHRQAVQVYDGGSIPTTVPAMYLTRPMGIGVAETEGATSSLSVDTTRSIPVLVLGPEVPVAGDRLIASTISGRWVAGMQGGAADTPTCSPCSIPLFNLRGTWVTAFTTTGTFFYAGSFPQWGWPLGDGSEQFSLVCTDGVTGLDFIDEIGGHTPCVLVDYTCEPFHLHWHLTLSGVTSDVYVDYP